MGWFGPSPKEVNVGGKIHYEIECNRGKCRKRLFKDDKKRAVEKAFNEHQRAHDAKAKSGAGRIKALRDKRAAKKGLCPSCRKDPCKMVRKACIQSAIGEWGSSHDLDMSDPATFDEQLNWYKKNMQ